MQKIVTYLWFDNQAEEAAKFYTSLFKNSTITEVTHYPEAESDKKSRVMTVSFQLEGQDFIALNGGPKYKFTEAVSLFVNCNTQEEIDELWAKFTEGGEAGPCGWLKDKYGLSWQIAPARVMEMLRDPDPEKVRRVTDVMWKMGKLDLAALERAYDQK
jgi:predicted 3-demethylubiquinone-9 3-methyltransferase (glyoxalase superfamily)